MGYQTTQINDSATISEAAASALTSPGTLAAEYDSNGNVKIAAGTIAPVGIFVITNGDTVESGERVDIQVKDIGLWTAGAAVAKGAELTADTAGKAITATAGKFILAIALEAAAAAGEIIKIQIVKAGYKPAVV
ncbi:capsid cement protein [Acetobacterium tundrae]|uniref:Head decoration protein n=1 Tax=Acetobacterium tundrae TaxID=132932 RepID=A0ABR6WP13_9FIRM|nr:capsid cement protein [Acetobacterium tundrae]MBC3798036.1 hypothetical protein [Acetobacterium tundrae]